MAEMTGGDNLIKWDRPENRVGNTRPEDTRLQDGRTIAAALMPDNKEGIGDNSVRREIGEAVNLAAHENPELLSGLAGKTVEQARDALQPYLDRVRNGQADKAA